MDQQQPQQQPSSIQTPEQKSSPWLWIIFVIVLIAGAAYIGWTYWL